MNTNELRAAAERILEGGGGGNMAHPVDHDAMAVARGYLAEHPADSDEPISRNWLLSVGFKAVPSDMGSTYHDHYQLNLLNLWQFNGGPWLVNGADWMEFTTRGSVRRLCAALGLELKE